MEQNSVNFKNNPTGPATDARRQEQSTRKMPGRQPRCLRKVFSLDDFEALARRHLPRPLFGYVSGATENNVSMHDNRKVFDEISFRPHMLVNVTGRSQAFSLFGHQYDAPFGIAPMGISALTAYRGDLIQASAAARANIPMIMSAASLIALEDVARVSPAAWFQAYLPGDDASVVALVDRVARAGFGTLVVTIDSAVVPNRENNLRNGFKTPLRPNLKLLWDGLTHPRWSVNTFLRTLLQHGMPHFENATALRGEPLVARNVMRDFSGREHLDWGMLRRVREQWRGRLVIKGILRADDARQASDLGVDGMIVSNHGGRQLDGAISPLRALPEVVEAVGDIPVMIDSGFRRGTDILKAIGLGARCVFIGRPFNYAGAVAGEAGLMHAIALLKSEIRADMGMLGINRLEEMGPELLALKSQWPFARLA